MRVIEFQTNEAIQMLNSSQSFCCRELAKGGLICTYESGEVRADLGGVVISYQHPMRGLIDVLIPFAKIAAASIGDPPVAVIEDPPVTERTVTVDASPEPGAIHRRDPEDARMDELRRSRATELQAQADEPTPEQEAEEIFPDEPEPTPKKKAKAKRRR